MSNLDNLCVAGLQEYSTHGDAQGFHPPTDGFNHNPCGPAVYNQSFWFNSDTCQVAKASKLLTLKPRVKETALENAPSKASCSGHASAPTLQLSPIFLSSPRFASSERICDAEIRPHRFGGEGVLIGVQSATLNAQVTFVYIAVAISALAGGGGGPSKISHRNRSPAGVFVIFRTFFGVWIWGIEMEFWVVLGGFWDWKRGETGTKFCA